MHRNPSSFVEVEEWFSIERVKFASYVVPLKKFLKWHAIVTFLFNFLIRKSSLVFTYNNRDINEKRSRLTVLAVRFFSDVNTFFVSV